MLRGSEGIPDESLRRLHSQVMDERSEIRELLERARRQGATLESRLSRVLDKQTAHVEAVNGESLLLRTSDFDAEQPEQIFLNLALDDRLYFFSVRLEGEAGKDLLRVRLPVTVFYAERRERERRLPNEVGPTRVVLRGRPGIDVEADIADYSADGLLVNLPEAEARELPNQLRVSFLDGPRPGSELFGLVRHRAPANERQGWRKIGLSTSAAPRGPLLEVEQRDSILADGRLSAGRRRWTLLRAGARAASESTLRKMTGRTPPLPSIRTLEFENDQGEHLKATIDGCGELRGAPLVLMPPAWAKTKETLLPLARTIVETFRRANESVVVARMDGIRRRGESYNDPECEVPGHECHHMTFSQGVSDIRAALDYFEQSEEFQPSKLVLVTFSGAAIEARRALAADRPDRVSGWVSVVGAADLKTGLRVVSGGVDYIGGHECGVSFGIQRILGIEVDMDRVAADALAGDMTYLEDARRDMAKLDLPITWIQGRHDAWIDPHRVRDMLSCGDVSRRRLIDVPTGHQLRSSKEAMETFQLIAQEIGRIVLGRELAPTLPDLAELERRRQAERARLPGREIDLRAFWKDYLLGRDRKLGMEILTASRPYGDLMQAQVRALQLAPGQRLADLGAGTGAFPLYLAERLPDLGPLEIHEIDYVHEAFERARKRLAALGTLPNLQVQFIECDLDLARGPSAAPVEDGAYDGLLASLLFNYVDDPSQLLAECLRLLRPGGRLVLSTLRRDTDISRIWEDVSSELHTSAERFGAEAKSHLGASLRGFLNEAARLLDFEESGVFHFWDAEELQRHLRRAGFIDIESDVAFGDPPQAIVVSARRPQERGRLR
jgi:ubiquinone/menaquinone biosynthesis C-methylase UbiE